MSGSRRDLWTPRKRDIEQAKAACICPPDVLISKLPRDANLITGTGIRDGALVLSPSHLKYIRFPLHPLFHVILGSLDLHPMQLSPNSYLQLSAFLAFGLQVGVSIDSSDFFQFHECVLIREEVDYFHFASKPNCRSFVNKPSSHKNWKHRPLLITGNWAAPEVNYLSIRSTFAASAASFTTRPIPERIQWLKSYLEGSCLDIKELSTPALLLQISEERSSIIYSLFQRMHLKLKPGLEGKELATHIVESLAGMDATISESPEHVAERERMRRRVEKGNLSGGETDVAVQSFEDPDRVDLNQVEPTMVRELPDVIPFPCSIASKLKKRSGSSSASGVEKRLRTVQPKSITFNEAAFEPGLATELVSKHSLNPWIPKFKKDDGTMVTEEEKLVGNPEACLAVWKGLFHPADDLAFQKTAPEEIMKAMNTHFIEFGQMAMAIQNMLTRSGQTEKLLTQMNESRDKQLEELKVDIEREKGRIRELEGQFKMVEAERDEFKGDLAKLQEELTIVKQARELEFQNARKKIVTESARYFRFGWVQASRFPNERIVACPDDLDTSLGLEPRGYEYFLGMKPSDRSVKNDSENEGDETEPEDEDDQDDEDEDDQDDKDEDDQGDEDEPEDEDERHSKDDNDQEDNEDFSDPDCLVDLNKYVENSQNSYIIHVETSPNRTHLPPQLIQEISDTTAQQNHPGEITSVDPGHQSSFSVPRLNVHGPAEDVIRLNSVARFSSARMVHQNVTGFCAGGFIRDTSGIWSKGYAISLESTDSVIDAELDSLWFGLHLAWNAGYRHIVVETDSNLAEILRPSSDDTTLSQKQLNKRQTLVRKIMDYRFTKRHITREQNKIALHLASLGDDLPLGRVMVFDSPPATCIELIIAEKKAAMSCYLEYSQMIPIK